jgi:hypothetical protein
MAPQRLSPSLPAGSQVRLSDGTGGFIAGGRVRKSRNSLVNCVGCEEVRSSPLRASARTKFEAKKRQKKAARTGRRFATVHTDLRCATFCGRWRMDVRLRITSHAEVAVQARLQNPQAWRHNWRGARPQTPRPWHPYWRQGASLAPGPASGAIASWWLWAINHGAALLGFPTVRGEAHTLMAFLLRPVGPERSSRGDGKTLEYFTRWSGRGRM